MSASKNYNYIYYFWFEKNNRISTGFKQKNFKQPDLTYTCQIIYNPLMAIIFAVTYVTHKNLAILLLNLESNDRIWLKLQTFLFKKSFGGYIFMYYKRMRIYLHCTNFTNNFRIISKFIVFFIKKKPKKIYFEYSKL